ALFSGFFDFVFAFAVGVELVDDFSFGTGGFGAAQGGFVLDLRAFEDCQFFAFFAFARELGRQRGFRLDSGNLGAFARGFRVFGVTGVVRLPVVGGAACEFLFAGGWDAFATDGRF